MLECLQSSGKPLANMTQRQPKARGIKKIKRDSRIQCVLAVEPPPSGPEHRARATAAADLNLRCILLRIHLRLWHCARQRHSLLLHRMDETTQALRVVTRGHVAEGGEAGLDGVGLTLVDFERLAAVAEELREGDGAERHGLEVLQVGGRRLRHEVQLPQEGARRRVCQ
jgi:hypothetical protein